MPSSRRRAPDVLRVTASIVDLDFVRRANAGGRRDGRQYIVSTADMSLVAELRDSQSGAMLARVADRKRGRITGNLQVADQVAHSTAEARAAFTTWAGLSARSAGRGARSRRAR